MHISHRRNRGAVSILAMMFLVIFGSLAAAMSIVAQGNLMTADSHLKINRSLSAAETGLRFMMYRVNEVTKDILTTDGLIDESNAGDLWDDIRTELLASMANEFHNLEEPYAVGDVLHVGPIAVAPGAPTFEATLTPHPILGENYDAAFYQRAPYSEMDPPVSNANPLGSNYVRVRVQATDGPTNSSISRAIQMDFHLTKKIDFAILSKSRIMIGRNVMIDGSVGSRFIETNLEHGHPVQMVSDFRGLHADLDTNLDALVGSLVTLDMNGDNRLDLTNPSEVNGIADPQQYDTDGDGFIDDYDFFMAHFDNDGNATLTGLELDTANNVFTAQLMELIDTFGDPNRPGYGDGVINHLDRYAKIQGQIRILADMQSWLDGAAEGTYQDYFGGSIRADHNKSPLEFESEETTLFDFSPQDFDVASFRTLANGNFETQVDDNGDLHDPDDPDSPHPAGEIAFESVPFGSPHPYDFYDRPVFRNMTFTNVKIPKGTNALFVNCTFIGTTFIEMETANTDDNYNFAGMQESDGSPKHPDKIALVGATPVADTKTIANNIRFDGCTFEGGVVTDAPLQYTHVRNKITFTGNTKFVLETSTNLSASEKIMFKRSTILAPHVSLEMGTFVSPADSSETVNLSGTIVAGLADLRGQIKINGALITTFEPASNSGPVLGDTSPQFNTTLGYFPSEDGDLESELPVDGIGVIHVRYDPTIPLPDGIQGPVTLEPVYSTYFEGGN